MLTRSAACTPIRSVGGFSLIELMVVLVVAVWVMTSAAPSMATWLADSKVQATAEQLQNSLRLAQSEALRRGRITTLVLTNSTPNAGAAAVANGKRWVVQALPLLNGETRSDSTALIQSTATPTTSQATITGPAMVCFNSIGRQTTQTVTGMGTCTAQAQTYSVTATGAAKTLRVTISMGGQIRMCNAAKTLSSSTPDGC